jgi:hypothetical protein
LKDLIFVGRSDDNSALVFMDNDGQEFRVEVDEHIVRNVNTQKDNSESAEPVGITPRDIQTRIRRGELPQDIAREARVSIDRIERYAGPVYAERQYMTAKARETFVRRPHGETRLEDIVVNQLIARNVDILTLEWDSFRRDDNRWTITVLWASGSGTGGASWIYDPLGHSIVALDDEARWLFDEAIAAGKEAAKPLSVVEPKPRLVGLPTVAQEIDENEELDSPAWAGPGHPTVPVPMPVPNQTSDSVPVVQDDSPSWDDILFGNRPTDQ